MSTKIKVLLVEDDSGDAKIILEELSESIDVSFDLTHVENLSDAKAFLENEIVDVILLDLSLPDSTGIDTFNDLFSFVKSIPIIVLSGLRDESLAFSAVSKGAQDYLVKDDIHSKMLIRVIKYSIERSKSLKELRSRENLFMMLTENISEMVVVTNSDCQMLYVSPVFTKLVGEDKLNESSNYSEFVCDEDKESFFKLLQNAQSTRSSQHGTFKTFDLNNNLVSLQTGVVAILNEKSVPEMFLIVLKNST